MSREPYVGRPMKRVEDPRLLTGVATYVDDLHKRLGVSSREAACGLILVTTRR